MATLFETETLTGTDLKKILNRFKPFKNGRSYLDFADKIRVTEQGLSMDNYNQKYTVRYHEPVPIPPGLYDLFSVVPLLTKDPIRVKERENGIVLNGMPLTRLEGDTGELITLPADAPLLWHTPVQEKVWTWLLKGAAPSTDTRPILKGIAMYPGSHFASVSGSVMYATPGWHGGEALGVIPPISLGDGELSGHGDHWQWEAGSYDITGKYLDGAYPDLSHAIPETYVINTEWEYADLLAWIKPLPAITKGHTYHTVDITQGLAFTGVRDVPVRIPPLVEWDQSILVDAQFLAHAISTFPVHSPITILLSGQQSAMILEAEGYRSLILPQRPIVLN